MSWLDEAHCIGVCIDLDMAHAVIFGSSVELSDATDRDLFREVSPLYLQKGLCFDYLG